MEKDNDVHVVMLPYCAFGHLIPFFSLSIALAEAGGVHVSFISTPKNIKRLPKVPPNITHLVKLVEFQMPVLDDKTLLPEGAEASVDIPTLEQVQYLKAAYDLLQEPIERFIVDEKPDWIISDFAPYWIVECAETLEIPIVYFSIFPAVALGFGIASTITGEDLVPEIFTPPLSKLLHVPSNLSLRRFEALEIIPSCFQEDASGASFAQRAADIFVACRAMAIRSCKELDGDPYLDAVHKLIDKPAIPVGLLPTPADETSLLTNRRDESIWQGMFKWLDQQNPKSVIFVGFGSEMKPSKQQVDEIAYGLELSGLPFVWILQKTSWMINSDSDPLPEGFGSRTGETGVVHIGWAPQKEILAHPSIGFALNHGGWGSASEALQHGHVLVLLPLMYDQGINSRLLVEKGLGVEVERNEEDGSFTRNDIAKALRYAMVSKESEELKARTTKAAAVFGDQKLHDSYIASFVEYLKNNRNN